MISPADLAQAQDLALLLEEECAYRRENIRRQLRQIKFSAGAYAPAPLPSAPKPLALVPADLFPPIPRTAPAEAFATTGHHAPAVAAGAASGPGPASGRDAQSGNHQRKNV